MQKSENVLFSHIEEKASVSAAGVYLSELVVYTRLKKIKVALSHFLGRRDPDQKCEISHFLLRLSFNWTVQLSSKRVK